MPKDTFRTPTFDEAMAEAQRIADRDQRAVAAYWDSGLGLYDLDEFKGRTVQARFMNAARHDALEIIDTFLDFGYPEKYTPADIQEGLNVVNDEMAARDERHVPYRTLDDMAKSIIEDGELVLILPRRGA